MFALLFVVYIVFFVQTLFVLNWENHRCFSSFISSLFFFSFFLLYFTFFSFIFFFFPPISLSHVFSVSFSLSLFFSISVFFFSVSPFFFFQKKKKTYFFTSSAFERIVFNTFFLFLRVFLFFFFFSFSIFCVFFVNLPFWTLRYFLTKNTFLCFFTLCILPFISFILLSSLFCFHLFKSPSYCFSFSLFLFSAGKPCSFHICFTFLSPFFFFSFSPVFPFSCFFSLLHLLFTFFLFFFFFSFLSLCFFSPISFFLKKKISCCCVSCFFLCLLFLFFCLYPFPYSVSPFFSWSLFFLHLLRFFFSWSHFSVALCFDVIFTATLSFLISFFFNSFSIFYLKIFFCILICHFFVHL